MISRKSNEPPAGYTEGPERRFVIVVCHPQQFPFDAHPLTYEENYDARTTQIRCHPKQPEDLSEM